MSLHFGENAMEKDQARTVVIEGCTSRPLRRPRAPWNPWWSCCGCALLGLIMKNLFVRPFAQRKNCGTYFEVIKIGFNYKHSW